LARGLNVVRLQPPPLAPASFADARSLWDRAEVRACLDTLHNNPSLEAAILAARCHFRLKRPEDALERLTAALDASHAATDAMRGEYAVVVATAHHLLGDDELTDTALCQAKAYIYSSRDRSLEAELDLLESKVAWARQGLKRGALMAEQARLIAPTPKWQARSLEMLGVIAGAAGHYKDQIDYYERAWNVLDEAGENEPWLRGALLQVLSDLCSDLFRRELAERIAEREQRLHWTSDTEYMRFTTLRHVARCIALAGDHLRAFRLLRKASEIAPSAPWRILIFCERASLATEMNERLFAAEELDQAQSFAQHFDWSRVRGGERIALLRLAEVTAPADPSGARLLLETYKKKLPPLSPHTLWGHDNRGSAQEAYAFGLVALYSNDTMRAIERLTHAFEIWRGIDYVWRALDTAIRLSRLTGADVFTEYALRHASTFPNSWLAREAASLRSPTPTPAEALPSV